MGADIHMFVEVGSQHHNGEASWWGFGGRFNPGRNYALFGVLAGVRWEEGQLFEPKGLPHDIAWDARDYMYVFVDDKEVGDEPGGVIWNKDGESSYCTEAKAEQWAEYGHGVVELPWGNGTRKVIEHPDYHTHSWLTVDEYAEALKQYDEHEAAGKITWGRATKYKALLRMMEEMQTDTPHVRIVFCFDN